MALVVLFALMINVAMCFMGDVMQIVNGSAAYVRLLSASHTYTPVTNNRIEQNQDLGLTIVMNAGDMGSAPYRKKCYMPAHIMYQLDPQSIPGSHKRMVMGDFPFMCHFMAALLSLAPSVNNQLTKLVAPLLVATKVVTAPDLLIIVGVQETNK